MEKVTNRKYQNLLLVAVLFLFAATGCNKYNELGVELLPSSDLFTVKNRVLKEDISAYTFREDSIKTSNGSNSLLGSFNDPVFGNTTVDFAAQFRIQGYPDYGTNPQIDSSFLYLYYRFFYGDTLTPQIIRVYELSEPLYFDVTDTSGVTSEFSYDQNIDLKAMAYTQILGELEFTPKVELDTTTADTLYQILKIPMNPSLAEKLVYADSLDMINNDVFLNYFKGLMIESERLGSGTGALLSLNAAASSTFQGSALVVYFNNDENKALETPDTMGMPYVITEYSSRVNRITHDYSQTAFFDHLNSETEEDSLIYIQSTGGLESKINIDNLSTWRDSVNTAINKAELIFTIDTTLSDMSNFAAPEQLLFTYVDTLGDQYLPKDYSFSPAFYGGALGDDNTYRFNITQHLQQIIDGEIENKGFYLTTANKNSEANRVVLKGSTSNVGIKLVVTYSKYMQ